MKSGVKALIDKKFPVVTVPIKAREARGFDGKLLSLTGNLEPPNELQ